MVVTGYILRARALVAHTRCGCVALQVRTRVLYLVTFTFGCVWLLAVTYTLHTFIYTDLRLVGYVYVFGCSRLVYLHFVAVYVDVTVVGWLRSVGYSWLLVVVAVGYTFGCWLLLLVVWLRLVGCVWFVAVAVRWLLLRYVRAFAFSFCCWLVTRYVGWLHLLLFTLVGWLVTLVGCLRCYVWLLTFVPVVTVYGWLPLVTARFTFTRYVYLFVVILLAVARVGYVCVWLRLTVEFPSSV